MKEDETILLKTTRLATVVKRFVSDNRDQVTIRIDGRLYPNNDIDHFLSWCTNKNLTKKFMNLEIEKNGCFALGFDDHFSELRAASSERGYIEKLAEERLLRIQRFREIPTKPSLFHRIRNWIQKKRKVEPGSPYNSGQSLRD